MSLALLLSGCQAWTWTPEQRASHEAYEKGFAACDKLTDFMERKRCFDDLPDDLTQIDPNEIAGVSLSGIDHLPDHLSVQDFYVDGTPGAQAGQGGSSLCCTRLPRVWRPGLTVEVRWNVTNWRDCTGTDLAKRVQVERYDQLGQMWVHFLADGSVRVASSNYYPEGANHPGSKYPIKNPIPDKSPWDVYPYEACSGRWVKVNQRNTTKGTVNERKR
jgi:hypothetical protein